MIETARTHSVVPRLVVVSSGAHNWSTFDQQVRESSEPLKTLGSKECRTAQYVICFEHEYILSHSLIERRLTVTVTRSVIITSFYPNRQLMALQSLMCSSFGPLLIDWPIFLS
jgi:hypothetical protein